MRPSGRMSWGLGHWPAVCGADGRGGHARGLGPDPEDLPPPPHGPLPGPIGTGGPRRFPRPDPGLFLLAQGGATFLDPLADSALRGDLGMDPDGPRPGRVSRLGSAVGPDRSGRPWGPSHLGAAASVLPGPDTASGAPGLECRSDYRLGPGFGDGSRCCGRAGGGDPSLFGGPVVWRGDRLRAGGQP